MEDDHGPASICKFNQTGFCKFREHCRNKQRTQYVRKQMNALKKNA